MTTIIIFAMLGIFCVLAPQIGFAMAFAVVALTIAFGLGGIIALIMWLAENGRRALGMFG